MIEIIPGILEKEWSAIEKKINIVKPFAKTVHIDLIDGIFAANTTFADPRAFVPYTKDIAFELHMMVDNPLQYVKPWAEVGFRRFIGHIEKMPDQVEFVAHAQQYGEVGLALDGPTPLSALQVPLRDLDMVLILTVKAGASGQPFDARDIEKVRQLRAQDPFLPIAIDGGVHADSIQKVCTAGVTRCVATSAIFSSDPHAAYLGLHHACAITDSLQK